MWTGFGSTKKKHIFKDFIWWHQKMALIQYKRIWKKWSKFFITKALISLRSDTFQHSHQITSHLHWCKLSCIHGKSLSFAIRSSRKFIWFSVILFTSKAGVEHIQNSNSPLACKSIAGVDATQLCAYSMSETLKPNGLQKDTNFKKAWNKNKSRKKEK